MSCGNQGVLCQRTDDSVRAGGLHLKRREHSVLKVFNIIFNISSEMSLYSKTEHICILIMCSNYVQYVLHLEITKKTYKGMWQGKSSGPGSQVIFTRCHPLPSRYGCRMTFHTSHLHSYQNP